MIHRSLSCRLYLCSNLFWTQFRTVCEQRSDSIRCCESNIFCRCGSHSSYRRGRSRSRSRASSTGAAETASSSTGAALLIRGQRRYQSDIRELHRGLRYIRLFVSEQTEAVFKVRAPIFAKVGALPANFNIIVYSQTAKLTRSKEQSLSFNPTHRRSKLPAEQLS